MTAMHLVADIQAKDLKIEPIRSGFGRGLVKAAELDARVVAACADLTDSTKMGEFAKTFPDRFVEIGVAEQNLVTVGSGLAAMGKIPFVSSYAAFEPGRCWEQIRTTICLNNRPVKLIGSHAGLYTGADGATHQMLEDLALMRVLPNMVVLAPGDSVEAEKATLAMAKDHRPNYMRVTREGSPIFTTADTPFEIGKAYVLEEGEDITLIAAGTMTYPALVAAAALYKHGIDAEVVHVPTIKPLDNETILKSVRKTKHVVTVEEAQIIGGLGGAIAELLVENYPVPMKRMGMHDRFGESGTPEELLQYFGLTVKDIVKTAQTLLAKN